MFSNGFYKIVSFMRKCGTILYSGAGHRWQYGACALHAGYLRLQLHKIRLCNTHCFSTAAMVARTRLNVTLYVHFLSCYYLPVYGIRRPKHVLCLKLLINEPISVLWLAVWITVSLKNTFPDREGSARLRMVGIEPNIEHVGPDGRNLNLTVFFIQTI